MRPFTALSMLVLMGLLLLGLAGLQASFVTDTTPIPPPGAPGSPAPNLSPAELDQWVRGRKVFDHDFNLAEGVGTPDFNGDSCRACHSLPAIGGAGALGLNVFRFGYMDQNGVFTNLPGGQAASRLRRVDVPGREEADPAANVFEQRNTPSLFGLGLLEEISDGTILANQDPGDQNGDGVIGVAHMVSVNGVSEVGRFGWKASFPTLDDFARDGAINEVGLTVSDASRGFGAQTDNDPVADPEFPDADLADMIFYIRHLAPPARGGSTNPLVLQGEGVFAQIGCATCHIPSLAGANGPVNLYSDLLLHQVWPANFQGMEEPGAPMGFYRTPPLWGVSVSGPYLHDGRAETLQAAILLHDGEALLSRNAFQALTTGDKAALLAFLQDL